MEKKEKEHRKKISNRGVTNKFKSAAWSHSALPRETKQSSQNKSKLSERSAIFFFLSCH